MNEDIVARIDSEIEAWEHGRDAMRWSPPASAGRDAFGDLRPPADVTLRLDNQSARLTPHQPPRPYFTAPGSADDPAADRYREAFLAAARRGLVTVSADTYFPLDRATFLARERAGQQAVTLARRTLAAALARPAKPSRWRRVLHIVALSLGLGLAVAVITTALAYWI